MHLWMLFADNRQKPSHFLLVFHNSRQPQDSPILLLPLSTTIKYILIAFYFWNHRTFRAHLMLQLLQDNWLWPSLFRLLIISGRVCAFLAHTYWIQST